MVLPGTQEEIGQMKESCRVLHMENRGLQKIIQLFIEIRVISANKHNSLQRFTFSLKIQSLR